MGFTVGVGNDGAPDLGVCAPQSKRDASKLLYVVDPGPDGSFGDVSWVVAARRSSKVPLLIVQGVVTTDLTSAADIVLPGAAWVEKDAIYTNDQGRVQASSKALNPPGEAREDWQILAGVATSLGLTMAYQSSDDVRKAISGALPGTKYADAHEIAFARAASAANWLQASNPSERWKWDFLYQDLPPVKGHNDRWKAGPRVPRIPLKPVE